MSTDAAADAAVTAVAAASSYFPRSNVYTCIKYIHSYVHNMREYTYVCVYIFIYIYL